MCVWRLIHHCCLGFTHKPEAKYFLPCWSVKGVLLFADATKVEKLLFADESKNNWYNFFTC